MYKSNCDSPLNSTIEDVSPLNEKNTKSKAGINPALLLTSLIDVFAILVIYLLVSTSDPSLSIDSTVLGELPQANEFSELMSGFVIKIEGKSFLIDNKKVSLRTIRRKLEDIKVPEGKTKSVIIVSSKKQQFRKISPLINLAAEAGITSIKFAVLPGRGA